MSKDLFSRYIWLVDTIRRHGRIKRSEIDRLWKQSSLSDGNAMPRRTFYNYKEAIQQLFNINIECDQATFEYYIEEGDSQDQIANNWLLNAQATSTLITSARDISHRVFLEDVPSAREYLAIVIAALKENACIKFDYHSFSRSRPTIGIVLEPFFIKIFKQRWYVLGRNVKEDKIKTYALDRVRNAVQLSDKFEMPADFSPMEYQRDAYGIVVDKSEPKRILLKADPMRAKYLTALPLHGSQQLQDVHDNYSTFSYNMRITPDLVEQLLTYGSTITVLQPPELVAVMKSAFKKALDNYK